MLLITREVQVYVIPQLCSTLQISFGVQNDKFHQQNQRTKKQQYMFNKCYTKNTPKQEQGVGYVMEK